MKSIHFWRPQPQKIDPTLGYLSVCYRTDPCLFIADAFVCLHSDNHWNNFTYEGTAREPIAQFSIFFLTSASNETKRARGLSTGTGLRACGIEGNERADNVARDNGGGAPACKRPGRRKDRPPRGRPRGARPCHRGMAGRLVPWSDGWPEAAGSCGWPLRSRRRAPAPSRTLVRISAIPPPDWKESVRWLTAVLRHQLPGGPVHRAPRGGGHPAPRPAPVPGPHGAASPAVRHYLPGPAGGPRRRRGGGPGGRHEGFPESVGYAALAAGGRTNNNLDLVDFIKRSRITKLGTALCITFPWSQIAEWLVRALNLKAIVPLPYAGMIPLTRHWLSWGVLPLTNFRNSSKTVPAFDVKLDIPSHTSHTYINSESCVKIQDNFDSFFIMAKIVMSQHATLDWRQYYK